jgi:hypothetical protein
MIIKFAIKIIHPCVHQHEFAVIKKRRAQQLLIDWYCFCKLMLNMKNSSTPHPSIINFLSKSSLSLISALAACYHNINLQLPLPIIDSQNFADALCCEFRDV